MTVVDVTLRVSVTGFVWGRLRTSASRWTVVWARTGAAIAISAINANALLYCMTASGKWEMAAQYAKAMPLAYRMDHKGARTCTGGGAARRDAGTVKGSWPGFQ